MEEMSSFSRRDFLKIGGLSVFFLAVGGLGGATSANKEAFFGISDPKKIISEVPPKLSNRDIPVFNENFRKPVAIIQESFDQYDKWRKESPDLPELYYTRPQNYLDPPSLLAQLGRTVTPEAAIDTQLALGQFQDALLGNDEPYSRFSESSSGGIDGISTLILNDPGSGWVSQMRDVFKKKYGNDVEIWDLARSGSFTSEQNDSLKSEIERWNSMAQEYVRSERNTQNGKKLSSNVVFSYFLYKNKGNITHSVWDTSNWFEIQARNDIPDLRYSPDQTKARYLATNFIDEFSLKISIDWLNDVVDDSDSELWEANTDQKMKWKDYLLINRVGGFYHFWNIVALCGCVSPQFVKRMIASYSKTGYPNPDGDGYFSTDGREKMSADIELSSYANSILKMYEMHEK